MAEVMTEVRMAYLVHQHNSSESLVPPQGSRNILVV